MRRVAHLWLPLQSELRERMPLGNFAPAGTIRGDAANVPVTRQVEQSFTIQVPEQRTRTETYQVSVPRTREAPRTFTVMVPEQVTRQGTRTIMQREEVAALHTESKLLSKHQTSR